MRHVSNRRRFKTIACVLGLMMLAVILFSSVYIAIESDHECCGDGCHVCACLRLCENTLHGTVIGPVTRYAAGFAIVSVILSAVFFIIAVSTETLISKKIRLNN